MLWGTAVVQILHRNSRLYCQNCPRRRNK